MAGLHGPLPTLRPWPRGPTRTARGRRGSLLLRRIGLSPTTPGRSPGALPSPDEENPSPANPASSRVEPLGPLRFDRFRSLRLGIRHLLGSRGRLSGRIATQNALHGGYLMSVQTLRSHAPTSPSPSVRRGAVWGLKRVRSARGAGPKTRVPP